jgi:alpha-galactosidase
VTGSRALSPPGARATSPAMAWGTPARALSVPVAGVKMIELVARAPGGDNARLPVTWGGAALMMR